MGMMTQFRRWMGWSGKQAGPSADANWTEPAARLRVTAPGSGVRSSLSGGLSDALANDEASLRITVSDPLRSVDHDATHSLREPAKSKQDLINELRKHYAEVIDLVRKVNAHLDTQELRAERVSAIAARVETAASSLPEIRTQSRELNGLVRELTDSLRVYAADISRARTGEHEMLARLSEVAVRVARTEEVIAQRVQSMGDSVESVAAQAARIGDAVALIAAKESQRDARVVEAFEKTQRWLVTAVGVAIAGIVIAACVAALALT